MTSTGTQPENDGVARLSSVLNKIAGGALSFSEMEGPRRELAGISSDFNGVSGAAAEKLAEALPRITDYGSRWIAARMLRDIALKNETQGAAALTALCGAVSREKDAGMRYMLCDLLRDVGLKHENLAVSAATTIAEAAGRENDIPALMSEKAALLALGLKYASAAPVAIAGLSNVMQGANAPHTSIRLSAGLRDIALQHPLFSADVIGVMADAARNGADSVTVQQITRHMTEIALNAPDVLPQAVEVASARVKSENKFENIFAWTNVLHNLSAADPALVITILKDGLASPAVMSHADKRRAYICNLSDLADTGKTESGICSGALLKALKEEPDAHHRRLIIGGLMTCVRNRINPKAIRQGLKDQLRKERDRETKDTLERALRSLGYLAPAPRLVPL
ncbi:MAG: hypothetical protein EPN97_12780 [Alphaproteobacteria bacterium]|nr:MAG: hypothetical protein EPN97_12780 [Alphaproteobacteria bacterium]